MFEREDAQPLRQEGQDAFSWPTPRGATSHQLKRIWVWSVLGNHEKR